MVDISFGGKIKRMERRELRKNATNQKGGDCKQAYMHSQDHGFVEDQSLLKGFKIS